MKTSLLVAVRDLTRAGIGADDYFFAPATDLARFAGVGLRGAFFVAAFLAPPAVDFPDALERETIFPTSSFTRRNSAAESPSLFAVFLGDGGGVRTTNGAG